MKSIEIALGEQLEAHCFSLYYKTAYFPVCCLLRGPCQIVCVRVNEQIKGLLCSYLVLVFKELYLHSHEKINKFSTSASPGPTKMHNVCLQKQKGKNDGKNDSVFGAKYSATSVQRALHGLIRWWYWPNYRGEMEE